ncbi:MAG TPA: hypothetical protein VHT92_04400 [Candidatus Cybelea sp.]|jgi:Cu/Zn superoxide dismutase|nr:hypothetical protein [Candidatus Cybelea sp.]
MKRFTLFFGSVALVLACAFSTASAATSTATVTMSAQNGSGESGTATLTQKGSDVEVVISLTGSPATTPQPAHIHDGTCADLKGVAYALANVVGGKSTTTVPGVTIDKLLGGPYAINVHESAANLGKYVSCGNIVKPSSM